MRKQLLQFSSSHRSDKQGVKSENIYDAFEG